METSGKVAIVTGAGQGIGRAIALRLAREGYQPVLAELDPESAGRVQGEMEALGRACLAAPCDVTKMAQVQAVVDQTMARFGRIDVLVNNAGVHQVRPILELTEADWDFVFAVNVKGVLFCSQAVAKELIKAQRGGKIINIASHGGKRGGPLGAHYAASKAAVISMTRAFALALAPHHINVNAVCPGTVDTDMWAKIDEETAALEGLPKGEVLRRALARIPLGRIETPEDVAGLVAFLASSDSDYMTGQAVNITGGVTTF